MLWNQIARQAPVFKGEDARFLLLTNPDLCADIFGGRVTLGKSAEERGRRWIVTEWIIEYVRAAAERFKASPGFWLNPAIASC